jgi:diguanylate cyclase (GGDEF)-like protein
LFATLGHDTIPVVLNGDTTTTLGHMVLFLVWGLSVLTLIVLWRSGPHTMLDIWLLVTMCVWVFDIAMAALLNNGRYDLGWYVGRIYGLVAASCLLILLLLENGRQYARLVRMSVELSVANQALAQLTRHDGLTGLANRRYFDEYLAQQTGLAQRHKRALALVLCDVDHFKAYNDHYGHPAGDECLKQVALVLRASSLRAADMPARYGGEEFAMILPETELAGAIEVAEAARTALLRLRIPHCHSSADGCLSMSFGVAVMPANAEMAAEELIAMADLALYEAKRQGRNRVLRAGQDSPAY